MDSCHNRKLILCPVIVLQKSLRIKVAYQMQALTLWCNGVGDGHIYISSLHSFCYRFTSCNKCLLPWGIEEHISQFNNILRFYHYLFSLKHNCVPGKCAPALPFGGHSIQLTAVFFQCPFWTCG